MERVKTGTGAGTSVGVGTDYLAATGFGRATGWGKRRLAAALEVSPSISSVAEDRDGPQDGRDKWVRAIAAQWTVTVPVGSGTNHPAGTSGGATRLVRGWVVGIRSTGL
jgi:hypothetical protein